MSDETFDRDAYAIELLRHLANGGKFEGDQIGPDHSLDQISVGEDLIEMGYMRGQVIHDGGQAVNIGFPGITAQGRKFLKSQINQALNPPKQNAQPVATVNVADAPVSDHAKLVEEL